MSKTDKQCALIRAALECEEGQVVLCETMFEPVLEKIRAGKRDEAKGIFLESVTALAATRALTGIFDPLQMMEPHLKKFCRRYWAYAAKHLGRRYIASLKSIRANPLMR